MDQREPLPATEITALLGRGTQFEGKLHFEGRVRLDGVFKGRSGATTRSSSATAQR